MNLGKKAAQGARRRRSHDHWRGRESSDARVVCAAFMLDETAVAFFVEAGCGRQAGGCLRHRGGQAEIEIALRPEGQRPSTM